MRKYLIVTIALICLSATSFNYFYSWSGLQSNQCVTFGDAQDAVSTSVFSALTTITPSTQTMTKTDASTYLNILTAYPSFTALASNQNVTKADLFANFTSSSTMYWQSNTGSVPTGYSSAAAACAAGTSAPLSGPVYWYGSIGNAIPLYRYDAANIYSNGTTGYFYMNGFSFTSSVGSPGQFTVANYSTCTLPTSTITVYGKRSTGTGGFLWWSSDGGTTWNNVSISTLNTGCNQIAVNITVPSSTSISFVLSQNSTSNDPSANGWYPTNGNGSAGIPSTTCPTPVTGCGNVFSLTSPSTGASTTIALGFYTTNPPC